MSELLMAANMRMRLDCPHCGSRFFETITLIRPGGSAYCPDCSKLFVLDPSGESTGRLLREAEAARRERKKHRRQLQAQWRAAPEPPRPNLTELLAALDQLLRRLDRDGENLAQRPQ